MKQKKLLIRYFFAIALLSSLVLQSLHGYGHFREQFSEKICFHQHFNKAELTHQHTILEQCPVCSLVFYTGISQEVFQSHFKCIYTEISFFVFSFSKISSFSGSLYSYRGPPDSIV